MKKILIFTGAGASAPLGLPTATGFIDGVENGRLPVTTRVMEYLGTPASTDIEWMLAALESFRTEVSFTEFMLPHLVAGQPNAEAGRPHIQQRLATYRNEARAELVRIKKLLFERLNKYDSDNAAKLYRALLGQVKNQYPDSSISLVTTNYDLTVEAAIEHADSKWKDIGVDEFNFGFSTRFGRPVYDAAQDFGWSPHIVEYLKIHGSLDWHPDAQGGCTRSMANTVPDDPDRMIILYPGFKGVPEVEPFISLHERLNKRLSEADVAIMIGFAFRDAYINNIFENALRLRKDFQILYFNPLSLDEHPVGSVARRLAGQYPRFTHHESYLELSQTPLTFPAPPETQTAVQGGSAG